MSGSRPRYSQQVKQAYVGLCRRYNRAEANCQNDSSTFIILSLQLHVMKGRVPQRMRRPCFVASCGGEI